MRVILGQEARQQQQPPPTAQQPPPPPVAAAASAEAAESNGGDDDDGYNSGDEYASYVESLRSRGLDEAQFAALLQSARGFEIRRMAPDGACLFRAIADQVYGDQELHGMVREMCCNFMEKERAHFGQYITEDFDRYIARKRLPHTHGNNVELQALAELYNRAIEVFVYSPEPINTFQAPPAPGGQADAPMRVSYHRGNHFNSVVDPLHPAVGVGLGLPGYAPAPVDRMVTERACQQSDTEHVDEQLVSRAVAESDAAETEEQLERVALEASRLEYLRGLLSSIAVPPKT